MTVSSRARICALLCSFSFGTLFAAPSPSGWGRWFFDDFESGSTAKWNIWSSGGGALKPQSWAIEKDGANNVLAEQVDSFAGPKGIQGSDYRLKLRVNVVRGRLQAAVRQNDDRTLFFVGFQSDRLDLVRITTAGVLTGLRSVTEAHDPAKWYTLELVAVGTNLKVYVDDVLKIDYTDAQNTASGAVMLWSVTDSYVRVDDVEVTGPFGQPVITAGGVLNAASYALPGLQNSDIAQGSMFVAFGNWLGPFELQQVQTFPLTTELAGTSIRISGGGVTADAPIIYTSVSQVAAILPSRIPAGAATMTLTYNGQASAPVNIRVTRSSFGIFTRNQAGSGPGIVQNYVSEAAQPLNALTDVAHPGQIMIVWGTGLGPVDFDEFRPPEVRNLDVDLEVLVGGKTARLLYKGRSSQFPGIDQINFELPADVPEGCSVPLALRTGSVVSNFASIAVAATGQVCSDPHRYTSADMEIARATGQLRLGGVTFSKMTLVNVVPGVLDQADTEFNRFSQPQLLQATYIGILAPPFGTCSVVATGSVEPDDPFDFHRVGANAVRLDEGSLITIAGPRGTKQLTKSTGGFQGTDLGGGITGFTGDYGPEYLVPGTYTLDNGTGGADVGPFRATLNLPATLTWTNQDSIQAVPRSQALTVTWSGADATREYVLIQGTSTNTTLGVGALFACAERASAGQFTIPSWILSGLPVSGTLGSGAQSIPSGMLHIGNMSLIPANRLPATRGIDVGYLGYWLYKAKVVAFQ